MKIQPISDMHLEFCGIDWLDPIEELQVLAPILVIAGDFCTKKYFVDAMRAVCSKFKYVVFVPGNHEYYHSSFEEMDALFEEMDKEIGNLFVLQERILTSADIPELEDKRILGTSLWFAKEPENVFHASGLNDFRMIDGFAEKVYTRNRNSQVFLFTKVETRDIVVTHHIPAYGLVPNVYTTSSMNRFFFCEVVEPLFRSAVFPSLWLYGHTHMAGITELEGGEYVCNPVGYPSEYNTGFDSKLVLEV